MENIKDSVVDRKLMHIIHIRWGFFGFDISYCRCNNYVGKEKKMLIALYLQKVKLSNDHCFQ